MAKLSHGHASEGASSDPLHFYSTNYSRHHGGRQPSGNDHGGESKRTRGTGYIANFRPALYYTPHLDHKDNPHMLSLLADNYTTLTAHHYQSPAQYARHVMTALPTCPSSQPLMVTERKGLSSGSCGHVTSRPGHMSSETHSRFTNQPFRAAGVEGSQYSQREETGFTHAQNIEPITFRPSESYSNDLSPQATWRPTGSSRMKTDFTLPHQTTGNERVPLLSKRADHSNGYVKGSHYPSSVQPEAKDMVGYTMESDLHPSTLARAQRQDPAHFSTITHPHHFSSYTHYTLRAGRERGGREGGGGRKELTGYSENNQPLVEQRDRGRGERFSTHYTAQFSRPPLHSGSGGVASGIAASNGFSRGTQVHGFGGATHTLYSMHPSQARLVLHRDPCYDDHTHHHKHNTQKKTQP